MENCELFGLLDIPEEVIDRLNEYGERRKGALPQDLCRKLLSRGEWEQGVKDLQAILAEDTDGIHILWEQLNIVCGYSYDEYVRRGIGIDVFVDTMKFCTRFLREHYAQYGVYKYVWHGGFPGRYH